MTDVPRPDEEPEFGDTEDEDTVDAEDEESPNPD